MLYRFTRKSRNSKTGPIPVTTTERKTCPNACPLKKNGCFADGWPLALIWKQTETMGITLADLLSNIASLPIGQLWRHNQAGDLPGTGNRISAKDLRAITQANQGKRGFTYTHKPMTGKNAELIKEANANGFTINLSANNLAHADTLATLNIGPVVTILPTDATTNTMTPQGRTVVICPAITGKAKDCATCQLCQRKNRKTIVGFPAHGTSKRKASLIAT